MQISKELCRICLNNPGCISLFDKGAQITIIEAILSITNIHILCNENYPNSICISCLESLNSALKLCDDVRKSEEKLKQTIIVSEDTIDGSQKDSEYEELFASNFCEVVSDEKCSQTENKQSVVIELDTDEDEKSHENVTSTKENLSERYSSDDQSFVFNINTDNEEQSIHSDQNIVELETYEDTDNQMYSSRLKKAKRVSSRTQQLQNNYHQNEQVDEVPEDYSFSNSSNQYTCTLCMKHFTDMSSLTWHSRLSHGPSPSGALYTCDKCFKVFKKDILFKRHMLLHGEKNHVCNICGKAFHRLYSMKTHIRTVHLKEKRYKCSMCDKAFGLSVNLKSHFRCKHIDDKPFQCHYCQAKFFRIKYLHNHLIRHHPSESFENGTVN